MKQAFESRLNIALSELLNIGGVSSRPEYKGVGRKDVLIHYQGLRIVLEGSYDRNDAEKDARHRIEQLSADIAIAVHYSSSFPQDLAESALRNKLLNSDLWIRIILPEDISGTIWEILHKKKVISQPYAEWLKADLNFIATLIREVAQLLINETALNAIEQRVEAIVDRVIGNLYSHSHSDVIAEHIYNALYKLYGFSIGDPKQIKEALFAQATLAILLGTVYYESIRPPHNLPSVRELANRLGAQQGIEEAVRRILVVNYELIFDLVRSLLTPLPQMDDSFNKILDLASEIRTKRALLRRDLGGKVYHKVVGSWALKKGLATFYTQVPSAYLLLHLAKPKLGKVADFACGSGTLLVAAYSAMNSQHRLALWESNVDKPPEEIERAFHRRFISNCYAFDVLGYALQITILNLALHSPETTIDGILPSQVIPLGFREKDSFVSLGSLELARSNLRLDRITNGVQQMGVQGSRMVSLSEVAKSKPFDLIVMNPPFSRTTGRGGKEGGGLFGFVGNVSERSIILKDYNQLRNDIRGDLIEIASELLRNTPLNVILTDCDFKIYRQIWQAGEGLLFIYLADSQIDDDGKICFVLPRGLLSGVSWFLVRTLLAANYHIEYIVISYESNAYNFSESTSLGECMFVAQRKIQHDDDEKTKFVMILKKPSTSIESIALSNAIDDTNSTYVEAGKSRAFIRKVPRHLLVNNVDNWGRFVCLPELETLKQIERVLRGRIAVGEKVCSIPIVAFNELISTIGVDPKRFGDTFKALNEKVPGAFLMIKGGEEKQRLRLSTTPNAYLLPISSTGREMFADKGGAVFVPDRIRITTAHVIAMLSDKKALSNIFYSVNFKKETSERNKALCIWMNSTWGILSILSNRQETHGGWIRIKMTQWRTLQVLDIDKLTDKQINLLAQIFDRFQHEGLTRIPDQYKPGGVPDEVRIGIDQSFLSVFGLDVSRDDLLRFYRPIGQALEQWLGE